MDSPKSQQLDTFTQCWINVGKLYSEKTQKVDPYMPFSSWPIVYDFEPTITQNVSASCIAGSFSFFFRTFRPGAFAECDDTCIVTFVLKGCEHIHVSAIYKVLYAPFHLQGDATRQTRHVETNSGLMSCLLCIWAGALG